VHERFYHSVGSVFVIVDGFYEAAEYGSALYVRKTVAAITTKALAHFFSRSMANCSNLIMVAIMHQRLAVSWEIILSSEDAIVEKWRKVTLCSSLEVDTALPSSTSSSAMLRVQASCRQRSPVHCCP
jgi:hypothetical protein